MRLVNKQQLLKEYESILSEYYIHLKGGGSMKIWYENKYERFSEICNIFEQICFDPHADRKIFYNKKLRQIARNKIK